MSYTAFPKVNTSAAFTDIDGRHEVLELSANQMLLDISSVIWVGPLVILIRGEAASRQVYTMRDSVVVVTDNSGKRPDGCVSP